MEEMAINGSILRRVGSLERESEHIKKDLFNTERESKEKKHPPFASSIHSDNISDEKIEGGHLLASAILFTEALAIAEKSKIKFDSLIRKS